jgi:exopolyphosphatase / guanosine-5'-triphosphate,3'-diphosphate pyrophosphatase
MEMTSEGALVMQSYDKAAERAGSKMSSARPAHSYSAHAHAYAALDLGTNNCRLLIARPSQDGFRIIDAFSRIVRLGEGLIHTGALSEEAMQRTIAALEICRDKMQAKNVTRARLIATEACRIAANGAEFISRVKERTGLDLEIVDRETEAYLAASGCASLADERAKSILLFDIGGGSTEIVWLRGKERAAREQTPKSEQSSDFIVPDDMRERVRVWTSLRLGVVTLADRFGGKHVDEATYHAMVTSVQHELHDFVELTRHEERCPHFHLLGTSGTVTTIAGVHLGLLRYDRRRVDGLWMDNNGVSEAIDLLRSMSYEERAQNGCIGPERADLVLAGCAILDAIRHAFPSQRIRIADRGLREGILMQLMSEDRAWGG